MMQRFLQGTRTVIKERRSGIHVQIILAACHLKLVYRAIGLLVPQNLRVSFCQEIGDWTLFIAWYVL